MHGQLSHSPISRQLSSHIRRPLYTKRLVLLLLVVFCICSLSGCTAAIYGASHIRAMPEPAPSFSAEKVRQAHPKAHTYRQMMYEGAHLETDAGKITALHQSIQQTDDIKQMQTLITEYQTIYNNYLTQSALASIEYRKDTGSDYWRKEQQLLISTAPLIERASDDLLRDLFHSPHREVLLQWQPQLFKWLNTTHAHTDATQPLLIEEATLVEEYSYYLNHATTVYRGQEYSYASLQGLSGDAYAHALESWLGTHFEPLAEQYIAIVQLRDTIAKTLGYQTYTQLHFDTHKGGYTAEMAAALVENTKQKLVPVFASAVERGLYEHPRVSLSYQQMLDFSRDVLGDLSPDFLEALDYMQTFELCDADVTTHKETGASTTYIMDYKSPYILLSYTDDQRSMQSFLHEFAHFQDDFSTAWSNPTQMDIAEIFPQALILLVSDYYPAYMGQGKGLRMQHDALADCFLSMLMQPYYTSIELDVYGHTEQLTPDYLRELTKKEYEAFGRSHIYGTAEWQHLDWVANPQVAARPFHTLTYATSADTALQIWERAQADQQSAMQAYFALLYSEEDSYMDRLQAEGLQSPFSQERAAHNAELLQTYIVNKDWSGTQTAG